MDESRALRVFSFRDRDVRVVEVDGEPWWVAKDVCDVLGIANPSDALERLDDDERSRFNLGRQGEANVVNEPGLFSLILGSRKPEAKAFKRWVTHEVLPSLRRNGFYVTGQLSESEEDPTRTLLRLVSKLEERISDLEDSIRGDRDKYRAVMLESASRRVREELPPAPPFTKVVFYPVSRAFDMNAQEFLADNIKGSSKYGMKLRLWEALQELAAERGWKIGAKSSFYRLCDAINEMFVD